MKFRFVSLFLCLSVMTSQLYARTDPQGWCGTRGTELTEYFLKVHERNVRERSREREREMNLTAAATTDIGEIAVIKKSPLTVTSKNPFDLTGKKITFRRNADGSYNVITGNGAVSATQGSPVALGDDASAKIEFTSGFTFPFYDKIQTSLVINSDGNITFGKADRSSLDRSASRAILGPARIMGYFLDLNPDPNTGRGVVNFRETSNKVTITWNAVTEFFATTQKNNNTFQINLFQNGSIELIYGTVESKVGVVGISPGKASLTESENVNFSNITTTRPNLPDAIWERFDTSSQIDYFGVLSEFHATHSPIFDFVVIFTDFGVSIGEPGAFAFFAPIYNNVRGIGQPTFNFRKFTGSRKIQGLLSMGRLSRYPDDPNETFLFTNSTLDVMGQENGHRWGAYVTAVINGVTSTKLLGRDNSHWSFALDSDASELEGNDIRDNGNGTFTTTDATSKFSKLDLYLMGFLPSTSVPPFFFVDNYLFASAPPQIGVNLSGPKVTVTIDQVIQANGARVPSSVDSQKEFREAFILLTDRSVPTSTNLQKLDKIRTGWEAFFRAKTQKIGTIITDLP